MEIRHLRTFVTVAETLNVTAAARRLNVTQPALSRHIRDLEEVVGHPLFVRHRDGMRLTDTGVTLREQGGKALAAFDEALSHARGIAAKEAPPLRVGYYGSISSWANIVALAIEKLGRKFPDTASSVVELSCARLAEELRAGRLDVALIGPGDYGRIPGVTFEVACRFGAVAMVATNHRLAKKRVTALEDLRDEEIIGVSTMVAPGRDRNLIAACRTAGFTPKISNEAASLAEIMMTVKRRMGVGILGPLAMVVPHPGLVFIKLKSPGVSFDLHVAWAENAGPAAEELARLITAESVRFHSEYAAVD